MLHQRKLLLLLPLLCIFFAFVQCQEPLIPHGSQQLYTLSNKLSISQLQHSSAEETSYSLHTQLKINSVWHSSSEQLLQVYFTESQVSAPTASAHKLPTRTQTITKLPDRPFYISLIDGGKPSKVIAHTSRDQSLLNLERGIASLLQLRHLDGPVSELDVSGQCNSFYAVKSSTRIEKTKTGCSHWDLKVNYRAEQPLSVSQHSQEHIAFDLSSDGHLMQAASVETHRIALAAKPDVGSLLESQLTLQHNGAGDDEAVEQLAYATLQEAVDSLLEWYRVFDIEADVDGALSEMKGITLSRQIAKHARQLADEHIGHATLAVRFVQLQPLARNTKTPEFVEILQAHEELHSQLVDLLAAVQTNEAHTAMMTQFQFDQKSDEELLEKYLQALAVGTHPERAIIEQLYALLSNSTTAPTNKKLSDSVLQTLTALSRHSGFEVNDPLLRQISEYLLQQLRAEDCDTEACQTQYIRALQNLQDVSTMPTLLELALEGTAQLSVAALQALQSFPFRYMRAEHRQVYAQIFYQSKRRYDSSARTVALDMLLAMRPDQQQLTQLLDYLRSNDTQYELKTYVVQKLRMLADQCARFRALLGSCLRQQPLINNYDVLAQKGLTTVLRRQLSQTPAFNESLLSVQEIKQGILKRGSVELLLSAAGEQSSIFKLGIYTAGMAHLVGDGDAEEDEEVDDTPATAGMEISVQGTLLRPLVFFSGQSELMGHVWSGTASDPTPAYQATTLTQDHEHYVLLSSGATFYMRVLGASSIDLHGQVDFSIWNRNANTEIQQNVGAGIVGHMVAGCTWAKVQSDFVLQHEPKISLLADIDFSSGVKLCMQLQRPEMILTHSNTRSVTLSAAKPYMKKVHSKVLHKLPGRTLALNQKNNEMCNTIFS